MKDADGLIYDLKVLPWSPLGIGMQKISPKDNLISFGITNIGFDLGTEIKVYDTSINQNIYSGFETKAVVTSFYVEFSHEILKKKENHKRFVGIGIYPDLGYYSSKPAISTDFPLSSFYYGMNLAFVPTVISKLSDKISLMLSLPVSLFYMNHSFNTISKPSLPINSQRSSTLNIKTFPLYLRPSLALVF